MKDLDIHAEALFQQADALIDDKKFEEAVFILQQLIQREPPFGKAYNHLGWFYQWKVKDLKKAEECYKKAMEFSPQYYAGHSNYLDLLLSQQRWAEVPAVIEKTMPIAGNSRWALYKNLGIMYEKQGKYEEAIEAYKKFATEAIENAKFDEAVKSVERCKEKMKLLR